MLAHPFPFRITSQGYLIAFNQQKNSYVLHIFSIALRITNFLSIQSCAPFPATIDITTGKISSLNTSISNKTLSLFSKFTSIKVCLSLLLRPLYFPSAAPSILHTRCCSSQARPSSPSFHPLYSSSEQLKTFTSFPSTYLFDWYPKITTRSLSLLMWPTLTDCYSDRFQNAYLQRFEEG